MKVTVIKIGELKRGRRFRRGYRVVQFACEDGVFAMSYIATDNLGWFIGGPLVVGKSFTGARVYTDSHPRIIDADSPVWPAPGEPCRLKKKEKPKPKFQQQELPL